MSQKLWFIKEDLYAIAVFDDHDVAKEELFYIREEDPIGHYRIYGLGLEEIENYSEELELATSEGYIEK